VLELNYETVICVDLRPFNPKQADKGVKDYLQLLGFKPTYVVFLNFFVDFLHRHEGIDETPINRMTVGQRGTPASHKWTKSDLYHLVQALRGQGVCPLLGILASTRSDIWSDITTDGYFSDVLQTKRGNQTLWSGSINPLKRFANGSPYEDLFVKDLLRVLDDFGFEGYVAGDGMLGLRGPRETLRDSDFSDDMVAQFCEFKEIELPVFEDYDARADYIVDYHFSDWISFYVHRWAGHIEKLSSALRPLGKKLMAIDAWSRNPEEAITAFGIDYRLLYEKGLEGLFVQARETNKWRKHREGEYVREENSIYTFLTHKAYEPRLKYYWAEATANRPEFWNSLLDLPHVLERETYGYLWTATFQADRFQKTTAGICVIWGNDLAPAHWQWLVERWNQAYTSLDSYKQPIGATLIWGEAGVQQLNTGNNMYGHLFAKILNQGVCIQSVIHANELNKGFVVQSPLVTFDHSIGKKYPHLKEALFEVYEDRIEFNGNRLSWQEGVGYLKRMSRIRCSRGRILGFETEDGNYLLSLENPENLFYEHIEFEVPADIESLEVLPPREWYEIPESINGRTAKISVAPDGSTQVLVRIKQ
jgi:hypothetical protein